MNETAVEVTPVFRPGSPAALADAAFEVWRRGFATLAAVSVLTNLPLLGAVALLLLYVRDQGTSWGQAWYFAVLGLLSAVVAIAAWWKAVGTAAGAHAATVSLSGRPASAVESFGAALSVGAAAPLASAVRLIAVVAGSLFCVFPGPVAWFALALTPHAVVLERLPVSQAVVRAVRLAPSALPGVLTATVLALAGYVLAFAQVYLVIRLGEMLVSLVVPTGSGSVLVRPEMPWLALALAKTAVDPLIAAAGAVAWVDGRIRLEGLDLELRSQRLAGEALTIDPGAGRSS